MRTDTRDSRRQSSEDEDELSEEDNDEKANQTFSLSPSKEKSGTVSKLHMHNHLEVEELRRRSRLAVLKRTRQSHRDAVESNGIFSLATL